MAVKVYKPTTPGRRQMSVPSFDEVTKYEPEKSLLAVKKKHAGRNSYGRITVRHQGGGNKVKYRIIDFKRRKLDMPATVIGIEYDPNRTAYIALIEYEDKTRSYIIAPAGLTAGYVIMTG
ncbi:MAG: 50S ribosomal protein L2, partial [Eubacteriales bacterium]